MNCDGETSQHEAMLPGHPPVPYGIALQVKQRSHLSVARSSPMELETTLPCRCRSLFVVM
jgi:hypothetical protein